MARVADKEQLIAGAEEMFAKLWKLVDGLDQQAEFCLDAGSLGKEAHWLRDKNLRDVLVHLYEWHMLLIEWERANSAGDSQPFLPSPYTWKTYGDMNIELWKKHQSTALEQAIASLKQSHTVVLELIKKYTDEQLFSKGYFKWTGTTSLGQYCISATISHYEWAIKKLKKLSTNR